MFYTYLQRTDQLTNIILLCWMKSVRLKIWLKNNRKNNRTREKNNKKYKHKGGWKVFSPAYKKMSVSLYFPLFTNWFLCTWWNYLKLGTNVQEDRPMKTMSQNFLLAPNMYFTDRKAHFWVLPFFYRGLYFCNRNSYNVDTWEARVFGADKSSAKIWYGVVPGCAFYRPECKGIPVIGLLIGSILLKISGFSYNLHRKRSDR